ncbi:MAG: NAD-dependent epimerase/dehydratase family protein [Fidelibacterota bacterium]
MKALVTGASGFIGSHLVDALVAANYDVSALVRPTSKLRWLDGSPAQLLTGDIQDKDSLATVVADQDIIFHVAGAVIARNAQGFDDTNYHGSENLMEAIIYNNPDVKKVIYVSSLAAGGPTVPDHPLTENDPSQPISAYGISKYRGEKSILNYSAQIHTVAIRPPIVYGPRDKGLLTFFRIVQRHLKINLGWSDRYVTLIHVHDLIRAMILMAEGTTISGSFYYVDDGVPVRTWLAIQKEVAKVLDIWAIPLKLPLALAFVGVASLHLIQKLTGKRSFLNLHKYSELAQQAWICDGKKIREELGFSPEVNIENGFRETAEWYRELEWL